MDISSISIDEFLDEEGEFLPYDSPKAKAGLEKLDLLVRVVLCKHFYSSSLDTEELVSIGKLKALELIKGGTYNPKWSLKNFLYTGIRNALTNALYHQRKIYLALEDDLAVMADKVKPSMGIAKDSISALSIIDCLKPLHQTIFLKEIVESLSNLGIDVRDLNNKEVVPFLSKEHSLPSKTVDKQLAFICWSLL